MADTNEQVTWKYEPEDGNEVAFIAEYVGDRMIRFVCEFIDPPNAEDAALMIAAKNAATPTADAALIGKLRHQLTQVTEECAALRARQPAAKTLYSFGADRVIRKHTTENTGGVYVAELAGWDAGLLGELLASQPAAQVAQAVGEGFVAIGVKNLDVLVAAIERAESKGYLPDAIADAWVEFDYRLLAASQQTGGE